MRIPEQWQCDFPLLSGISEFLTLNAQPRVSELSELKRMLQELSKSSESTRLLNRTLSAISASPAWDPPHLGYDGQLLLHYAPRSPVLVLGRTESDPKDPLISTVGATSLVCPVESTRGFAYERGRLNRVPQFDRLQKDLVIESISTESCPAGGVLQLKPGEVFRYVSHGVIVLKIEYTDYLPLTINFSRKNLRVRNASMGTIEATQIIYLLRLMSTYGRATDVEVIRSLSEHAHHRVRWEALKALASLAPGEAEQILTKFCESDPHPEIRHAARVSIDRSSQ